jgi:hypothetical protein
MSEILASAVQAFWASRILDIRLLSFIPRSRFPNDKVPTSKMAQTTPQTSPKANLCPTS